MKKEKINYTILLELGKRYTFEKSKKYKEIKKAGELILVQVPTDKDDKDALYTSTIYVFRSKNHVFYTFSKKEIKEEVMYETRLVTEFDFIWWLMEKSNTHADLSAHRDVCKVMFEHISPMIKEAKKTLQFYANSVNPSECEKLAKKDCGNKARKALDKLIFCLGLEVKLDTIQQCSHPKHSKKVLESLHILDNTSHM